MGRRDAPAPGPDDDFYSMPFGEPSVERPGTEHAPFMGDITQLHTDKVKVRRRRRIGFRPPSKRRDE